MKSGSNLEKILKGGTFAVTGELGPPKNGNPEVVKEKAQLLKAQGSIQQARRRSVTMPIKPQHASAMAVGSGIGTMGAPVIPPASDMPLKGVQRVALERS